MRYGIIVLLGFLLMNCASRKGIIRGVNIHNQTFPLSQLADAASDLSDTSDIQIKSGYGLPEQSEVVRAGIFVLPLIFYNQFQSKFQIVLGQNVLDEQWTSYVDRRLKILATEFFRNGINQTMFNWN